MDFQRTLSRRLQRRGTSRRLEEQWETPEVVIEGPGGVGSPIGLLLTLTKAS